KRLATTKNETLLVWEIATGKVVHRLTLRGPAHLARLALSPDGQHLAVAEGSAIRLWDLATGKELNAQAPRGTVSFKLSPTGRAIATADEGGEIHVWELPTGKRLGTLTAPQGEPFLVGFTPEGDRLLWGSKYEVAKTRGALEELTTFHLWSMTKRKEVLRWKHEEYVHEAQLSPDGRWLCTSGSLL